MASITVKVYEWRCSDCRGIVWSTQSEANARHLASIAKPDADPAAIRFVCEDCAPAHPDAICISEA